MTPQKRLFDICLALLISLVVVPAIIVITLVLLLTQGRPVFYIAERMRTPSQSFGLVKFRTMRIAPKDSGVSGGDKQDRITPVGAKLRRWRLDELPQLWNVLRGDISFVGPRPPLRLYVDRFPTIYAQVLRSRPGVTGLATMLFNRHEARLLDACSTAAETDAVYGRRCVPRKATLDLIYQRNASVCYDFVLLLRTFHGLIRRR